MSASTHQIQIKGVDKTSGAFASVRSQAQATGAQLRSILGSALAAAGAQIVLFSTGRGTPFASPVPTVKISSNTPLAEKKRNWIDFNTGTLLTGKELPELAQALMDKVLAIAGGELVLSEKAGYHDMAIFKTGVTL